MRIGARVGLVIAMLLAPSCHLRPTDAADVTLTFADGRDTSAGAQIRRLVQSWTHRVEGAPGRSATAEFRELPSGSDMIRAALIAQAQDAQDSSAECNDVVMLDVVWTAEFAERGYIIELDPGNFDMDSYLPQALATGQYEERLWAIPFRTDIGLLFYRKDLLKKVKRPVPASWEQLESTARLIKEKLGVAGYVGQHAPYEGFTVNAMETLGRANPLLSADGREVRLVPERAAEALAWTARGFAEGWIPDDATDSTEESAIAMFRNGGVAFMRNWPYAQRRLEADPGTLRDRFDVAPLPGPSVLGGWNLAVSSCSRHPEEAQALIRHFTAADQQRLLLNKAGFAPTRTDLYTSPDPYLSLIRRGLSDSITRPLTPSYADVTRAVQQRLQPVLKEGDILAGMRQLRGDLVAWLE